jgi:hypothetical protein
VWTRGGTGKSALTSLPLVTRTLTAMHARSASAASIMTSPRASGEGKNARRIKTARRNRYLYVYDP